MKKLSLPFGVIISFIIALISLIIRSSNEPNMTLHTAVLGILHSFTYGILCWTFFSQLVLYKKQLGIKLTSVSFGMLSVAFSALLVFVYDWCFVHIFHDQTFLPENHTPTIYLKTLIRGTVVSSLYYFITLHLVLLTERQSHILEMEKLKSAQLEANMSSLKEQLSPHFLFNTLNTLYTLTSEQSVKDYVEQLSNIYRYVLSHKDEDTVLLKEEIAFANAYLHIIKIRLDEAISIEVNIDHSLSEYSTVPFSIQLLLENVIKHNIASVSKPLKIQIYNEEKNYIVVKNNLQEKKVTYFSTGVGLSNIMSRYKILFKKEITLLKTNNSFIVKLPIIKK